MLGVYLATIAWVGLYDLKGFFQLRNSVCVSACHFFYLILKLPIPNQPVIPLHCFITKWIRTDKLIKAGQQVHYVYIICILSISVLGSDWNPTPAASAFRLTNLSESLPHSVSGLEGAANRHLHYTSQSPKYQSFCTLHTPQKVHLSQFNDMHHPIFEHSFFSAHIIISSLNFLSKEWKLKYNMHIYI